MKTKFSMKSVVEYVFYYKIYLFSDSYITMKKMCIKNNTWLFFIATTVLIVFGDKDFIKLMQRNYNFIEIFQEFYLTWVYFKS